MSFLIYIIQMIFNNQIGNNMFVCIIINNTRELQKENCQFIIGNVSQLILSVSINDTTPLSPKNQYKTVKKSVDLQHHMLLTTIPPTGTT